MIAKLLTDKILDQFDIQDATNRFEQLHNLVLEEGNENPPIPISNEELADIMKYCIQNLDALSEYKEQADSCRKSGTCIDLVDRYYDTVKAYLSLGDAADYIMKFNRL